MKNFEAFSIRALPWLPAIIAVAITLRIAPYFGNMDDSRFVDVAGNSNPLSYAAGFFAPELGFIRSGSILIVWPAAWLGYQGGAAAYFLTNIAVVSICLAAMGFAYGRLAGWTNKWLFVAFTGVALAWPYTAEMFFFPSLSEKGVILGGAALLFGILALNSSASPWLRLVALGFTSLFAFSTKTQILLLVPGAIVMLWASAGNQNQRADRLLRWTATALWSVCSLGLVLLARFGSYTSQTQGEIGAEFLRDRRFLLIVGITGLYCIALLVRRVKYHLRTLDFVPVAFLFASASAFSIWEIRNYYLSVASVGVAAAFTTILSWAKGKLIPLFALLSITLACLWLTYRLPHVYSSLASVRLFLQSDTAQILSIDTSRILVSCVEAPVHYNAYAEDFNVPGLQFEPTTSAVEIPKLHNTYVFSDSRLCPWPSAIPRDQWTPTWTSSLGHDAYVLYSPNIRG